MTTLLIIFAVLYIKGATIGVLSMVQGNKNLSLSAKILCIIFATLLFPILLGKELWIVIKIAFRDYGKV